MIATERKTVLLQPSHGYFVHVYPPAVNPPREGLHGTNGTPWRKGSIPAEPPWEKGKPARVYLRTHDRGIAHAMAGAMDSPRQVGDAAECRRRRDVLAGKSIEQIESVAFHWGLDDNREYLDEWLAKHHPETLDDMDRELDDDRESLENILTELGKLEDEERDDLIQEHTVTLIDWLSSDHKMLHGMLDRIEKHLGLQKGKERPSRQHLSDCIGLVREQKGNQIQKKTLAVLVGNWELFIAINGDMPINHLSKAHFIALEEYLIDRGDTGATFNAKVKAVRQVCGIVSRKTDWAIPSEWERWYTCIDKKPYKPHKKNR